jgi:hypothetical protein
MQVLYRGTHWLRFLSLLESDEHDKELVTSACQKLRWWPCRFSPTMDGDGASGFVLSFSSFVLWLTFYCLLWCVKDIVISRL